MPDNEESVALILLCVCVCVTGKIAKYISNLLKRTTKFVTMAYNCIKNKWIFLFRKT